MTPETIQEITDALLAGMLKRLRESTSDFAQLVLRECKRRGPERIWTWWKVQQLMPDPCACGKPGLYIVGSTTYCRACHSQAKTHLATAVRTYEERRAEKESYNKEVERGLKTRDNLHTYGQTMNRQPWRSK